MAEAYWDLEWELQQQGFNYCYDKRLYDRLVHETRNPCGSICLRTATISRSWCASSKTMMSRVPQLFFLRRNSALLPLPS